MAAPAALDRKHTLVIVASSLGTVFEWYDFYIYGTLAAFFGKLFFPAGNETAGYLSSLALFGVGFSVRPFGALVFSGRTGRHGRPKVHLSGHDRRHGTLDGACRHAAHLCQHRHLGAHHPGLSAACPGPRARRGIRRRRDLRRGARPGRQARPLHGLDPDDRDARAFPRAGRDRPPSRPHDPREFFGMGMARAIPPLVRAPRGLRLHPPQAGGVADLCGDEGAREGIEGAAHRELRALGQREDRPQGALRGNRGPGRRLVWRAVLCPLFPRDDAQGRLRHDL